MTGLGEPDGWNFAEVAVSAAAIVGWLALNLRALQARRLSFELKAVMAVSWVIAIGGLAFALTRLGY